MATYKNISDNWYISLDGGVGTIYIDGNLDVAGNITYVTEIAVNDAFIIVAANNTGTVTDMGLVAQKTSNTFAGLRFDTTSNAWQISSSVYANGDPIAAYANLSSGGTGIPGGNVRDVQINNGSGSFTANGNFQFDIANSTVTVTGNTVLGNINATSSYAGNGVALYNKATGAGATGLYVVGATTTNDEVISLTRARLYAIIF